MSFEEVGRALDKAVAAIAESMKTIVSSIKSQFRVNRYRAVHVTVCAKRRRQPHVKRSYIRRGV